jgi:hypothetical protein
MTVEFWICDFGFWILGAELKNQEPEGLRPFGSDNRKSKI